MDTMTISVRLFAILRERAGQDRIALELDPGATVDDALAALAREPGLAEPLDRMAVAMAVNRDYASGDTELHAGDELALIPPVSGGAAEVHARVSTEPLSLERIAAILIDCCERHDLEAAAAEHRTGTVPLGEPSVIVAGAAGHRGEAFAGAREAIDRIKAEAPIWKQEVEGGEARWVEGTKPA
jgi:molybdopterin synthase catalytic subunit